jgi:hypothetical protein
MNRFPTFVSNAAVLAFSGKYFYELQLTNVNLAQIGFLTLEAYPRPWNLDGVGDDPHGWSYDGFRMHKYHMRTWEPYGEHAWRSGDIVGCGLDLDAREITFYLNGKSLGLAFKLPVHAEPPFFAAASLQDSVAARFLLLPEEVQHLPTAGGYMPMAKDMNPDRLRTWIISAKRELMKTKLSSVVTNFKHVLRLEVEGQKVLNQYREPDIKLHELPSELTRDLFSNLARQGTRMNLATGLAFANYADLGQYHSEEEGDEMADGFAAEDEEDEEEDEDEEDDSSDPDFQISGVASFSPAIAPQLHPTGEEDDSDSNNEEQDLAVAKRKRPFL